MDGQSIKLLDQLVSTIQVIQSIISAWDLADPLLLDLESREIPENEKQKEKVYAVLLFVTRGKETNKQTIRVQWRSALFIFFFFFFS